MHNPDIADELFHNRKNLLIIFQEYEQGWKVKIVRDPTGSNIEIVTYNERRVRSKEMAVALFREEMMCILNHFQWSHIINLPEDKMDRHDVDMIAEALKMKNEVKTCELFSRPVDLMQ